ncbi:MAG: alpha/beta hydrolase-fold protein [Algibacter sp.]
MIKQKIINSINLSFLLIIFLSPILCKIGFKTSTTQVRVFFVMTVALWGIITCVFSRFKTKNIHFIDINILTIATYCCLHFCIFSKMSFYYYKSWLYLSYFILFFIFRWGFRTKSQSNYNTYWALSIIVLTGLLQAIVAILQNYNIIISGNRYFSLLGSFTSPNFLGAYIGVTIIIITWFLFILKTKKKALLILGVLSFFALAFLLILSSSRGSWVSLIIAFTVSILTSKKVEIFVSRITPIKKGLIVIGIVSLTLFSSNHLYSLKPESVMGRALVAKISLTEITKQPITGHGLFSFANKYNLAKASYFNNNERNWKEVKVASYEFSPSNDFVLVTFELGIIVLIVIIAIMIFIMLKTKINNMTRLGLALFTFICSFALFNTASSSILLISVGLFGVTLILNYGGFNDKSLKFSISFNKYITKSLIFVSCCFLFYLTIFKLTNQNKFKNYSLKEGSLDEFNYLYNSAIDKVSSEALKGYKLYRAGYKGKGIESIENAFNKSALPSIGKKLAFNYIKQYNYKRAEEIFKTNINIEPFRYEARMNLIDLYKKTNDYKKLVDLSQQVVKLPVKIPSKKVNRYKDNANHNIKIYDSLVVNGKYLKGSLSKEKIISSRILDKQFPYKIYLPPIKKINKKLPIIYINDGYSYISKGKLPELLDSLIINNVIKPVAAVFLDPKDLKNNRENIRQQLFLCNPLFVDFFTNELIPDIERHYPISDNRNDRTVLGLSFGGLAAAYIAMEFPSYFKNIAMQSPAFHPCKDIYKSYSLKSEQGFKIYLAYGTGKDTEKQDLPFIKILKQKGYDLKVKRFDGGNHNWDLWKPQLGDILIYFYGK